MFTGLFRNFPNIEENCFNFTKYTLTAARIPWQPFLSSNRHFWQMTQMSDKCLLSKTEKLWYLDKLRLSESAETSGQNAYCTGFAVHTRLVCFRHHKKYDIFLLLNEIIQDRIRFRGTHPFVTKIQAWTTFVHLSNPGAKIQVWPLIWEVFFPEAVKSGCCSPCGIINETKQY